MTDTIINYCKELVSWGWKISNIYKGDYIPTYEFELFSVDMNGCLLDVKKIEITLYTKKTKKSSVIVLNGGIYPNDDEVIDELKRLGIK